MCVVMAIEGVVGEVIEVVICIFLYKAKEVGRTSGDAGAFPECEVTH